MQGNKIINLGGPPTAPGDAANKAYVDSVAGGTAGSANELVSTDGTTHATANNGSISMDHQLNMQNNKVINLGTPTVSSDATTKSYVDAHLPNQILSSDGSTYAVATNGNIQMNRSLQLQGNLINQV